MQTTYQGIDLKYVLNDHILPSSNYNFRTRAQNSIGFSNWSQISTFTTDDNGFCGNPSDIKICKEKYDVFPTNYLFEFRKI